LQGSHGNPTKIPETGARWARLAHRSAIPNMKDLTSFMLTNIRATTQNLSGLKQNIELLSTSYQEL
jgi:hypothetical protein